VSAVTSNHPDRFPLHELYGVDGRQTWRRVLAFLVAVSVPIEGLLWFALDGHWVWRFVTVAIWTLLYEEARSTAHHLIVRDPDIRDPAFHVAYRILVELLILVMAAVLITTHPDSPWQLDPYQGRLPVFAILALFVAFSLPDLVVLWSAPDHPTVEDSDFDDSYEDEDEPIA